MCAPQNKTPEPDQTGCGTHCGTERWRVKTATDDDANAVSTTWETKTVSDLVSQTAPSSVPETSRVPIEKTQVAVEALLIGRKIETDNDFHLVIADPSDQSLTMIAEIPSATSSPLCGASLPLSPSLTPAALATTAPGAHGMNWLLSSDKSPSVY